VTEPRRAWDRARERIVRSLELLRDPAQRDTRQAQDSLDRALEDLAGTERAVAPVYLLYHYDYTPDFARDRDAWRMRGVFTNRAAALAALPTERWLDVGDPGEVREQSHGSCCTIEEWLVLDDAPEIGPGQIPKAHQHAWANFTDHYGVTRRLCRFASCYATAPDRARG
jgi:hypothetical protein